MRVFVTGGCGFIGSHIVEFHLKNGDEVRVVDNLSTGTLENIAAFKDNPAFEFIEADIITWPDLEKTAAWADRIYHMAAVLGIFHVIAKPLNVLSTNIAGTERLLRAVVASGSSPRILIASSSSVYGNSPNPVLNENDNLIVASPSHPLWGYAISKIADEAFSIAYHKTIKVPVTLIRFFNTIGPRQTGRYGMVVPRFVQQACDGEPITIFGDGTQTRSFCDVRDVVTALSLLANQEESIGEIVNVGCDSEITINDLAKLVRTRGDSHSEITHTAYLEAYGNDFTDIKQRRPDLSKLYKLTGFKHKWTLEQTVDNLIALYQEKMRKTEKSNQSR